MQFWGPATLLKKTPTQVLSCEICKLFKNNYFEEHLWMSASKLYLKRDYNTGVFLWTLLFKNTYFVEDLQTAGSETSVWESLFNKVASVTAWKHLTVLETLAKVFLCEFCKTLRKLFCRTPSSNHFSHVFFPFCRLVRLAASSVYLVEQW